MVSKVPIFTSCFLSLKTLWHLDILTHSSSSPPPPLLLHIFSLLSTFRTFCVIPLSAAEQKKIALSQLYPYCSPGIMDQIRTFTLMPQRWLSLCIKQKRKNKKTSHLTPSGIRNDIHLVQSRVEKVGVILPYVLKIQLIKKKITLGFLQSLIYWFKKQAWHEIFVTHICGVVSSQSVRDTPF